jgi:hypothetical protein
MVKVELTSHLFTFFPELKGKELWVDAQNVAEVVSELEKMAPGLAGYICDERGSLRTHVNIFVGDERVLDRRRLGDPVKAGGKVFIMQALSGG